jgi:hypothetical protein
MVFYKGHWRSPESVAQQLAQGRERNNPVVNYRRRVNERRARIKVKQARIAELESDIRRML